MYMQKHKPFERAVWCIHNISYHSKMVVLSPGLSWFSVQKETVSANPKGQEWVISWTLYCLVIVLTFSSFTNMGHQQMLQMKVPFHFSQLGEIWPFLSLPPHTLLAITWRINYIIHSEIPSETWRSRVRAVHLEIEDTCSAVVSRAEFAVRDGRKICSGPQT
jgi:hypothetical protein